MHTREMKVAGAFEFTPRTFKDQRGLFVSPMQDEAFVTAVGGRFPLAQTNHSVSARGVLRGIHFTTTPPGQAKYVYCPQGHARDVVVDFRVGSPTFGQWDSVELDSKDYRAVYLPVGVGHAFFALEGGTVMSYMVSTPYRPEFEQSIDALDPDLKILAIRAVSTGQMGFGDRGISTDSARPVRDEFRLRAGPGRDCRASPRSATAGERGGREVGGHPRRVVPRPDFGGISEVYLTTDLHLYLLLGGARTGRTGRGAPGCHGTPPDPSLSRRHGGATGRPGGHVPA